jgi:hypothetical protein
MKAMVQMFGWKNKQDPSTCRHDALRKKKMSQQKKFLENRNRNLHLQVSTHSSHMLFISQVIFKAHSVWKPDACKVVDACREKFERLFIEKIKTMMVYNFYVQKKKHKNTLKTYRNTKTENFRFRLLSGRALVQACPKAWLKRNGLRSDMGQIGPCA